MDKFFKDKQVIFLLFIFLIISIVHIIYAAMTLRGLYEDGAPFMLEQLNNLSNGIYKVVADYQGHPRFCIAVLMQFPMLFSHFVLFVKSKFALLYIFNLSLFGIPILALVWNYFLAKRGKRPDLFFWSLFSYSTFLITFLIFAIVESIIGGILNFILYTYIAGKLDYKKIDIAAIIFLLIMMCGTYEYVIFIGPIFLAAAIFHAKREENPYNKKIKIFAGLGAFLASVFNLLFVIFIPEGEADEISRFLKEFTDFMPFALDLNISISLITLAILAVVVFRKTKISVFFTAFCSLIMFYNLYRLLNIPEASIMPMWETHLRTIPCYMIPLIFFIIAIKDILKKEINNVRLINCTCIVLLCAICQTFWQLVDTYYWDKNIRYMKDELAKTQELLYIPSEHEEISSFINEDLRRYIWHGVYAATSILFSDTYEQKTLLVNYDESQSDGNYSYREVLYVVKDSPYISIPFGGYYNIKNKFWDLTKCAKALDKYNKEHKIYTEDLKYEEQET